MILRIFLERWRHQQLYLYVIVNGNVHFSFPIFLPLVDQSVISNLFLVLYFPFLILFRVCCLSKPLCEIDFLDQHYYCCLKKGLKAGTSNCFTFSPEIWIKLIIDDQNSGLIFFNQRINRRKPDDCQSEPRIHLWRALMSGTAGKINKANYSLTLNTLQCWNWSAASSADAHEAEEKSDLILAVYTFSLCPRLFGYLCISCT